MNEIDYETPLVSSLLQIHYDKRFIAVAHSFVESLAAATGIAADSAKRLCLLVEESVSFVMDKYIDSRLEAHIELLFSLFEGGVVVIEIVDTGPPVHEDRIPDFDFEDPSSASGLWYKLVKDIADDVSFINKHKEGWLIRIEKRVDMDDAAQAGFGADGGAAPKPSLAGHQIRPAVPGDAAELIDLAYHTYRYSYAADFYSKETLGKAIARGVYEITVLDTGGRIVGAYIVMHPETGESWAEMGGAMVLPEYRTTRAVMYLFRAMGSYLQQNPRDCDFFTSHLVTTHPRSQKLLHKIQPPFMPLFLFPNMVPRPNYIGIQKGSEGRESLLWSYSLARPLRQKKLYAPEGRHEMIRRLLDNTGSGDAVTLDGATREPRGASRITVERVDHQGFALVYLEEIGADWFEGVTRELMALTSAGLESVAVCVSTKAPPPPDMETHLASIRLLFSGVHVKALDALNLAYCLTLKPVAFETIHLHDPAAQTLVDSMHEENTTLRQA